jgi:hypothetical protein
VVLILYGIILSQVRSRCYLSVSDQPLARGTFSNGGTGRCLGLIRGSVSSGDSCDSQGAWCSSCGFWWPVFFRHVHKIAKNDY